MQQTTNAFDSILKELFDLKSKPSEATFEIKSKNHFVYICAEVSKVFQKENNILDLASPINVIGDIHGNLKDLLQYFDIRGHPSTTPYLFLGDYVDRGKNSLEVILLLLILKIKYPTNVFMLRGNHECKEVATIYGLKEECKRFGDDQEKVFNAFNEVFDWLPIIATVNKKICCVHAGISPHLSSFQDVNSIKRPLPVPREGLLCDLLWSDPSTEISNEFESSPRGAGYLFSKKAFDSFMTTNNFNLLIRSHSLEEKGYNYVMDDKLLTLFSCSKYCSACSNDGAIASLNENLKVTIHTLGSSDVSPQKK
ncbi:Serine/threonine-protein phosphatase [Entamoeba marina]